MTAAGRLLVVGRGSFLAGHLLARLPPSAVRAVGHDAIDHQGLLDGIDRVVSFARHPGIGADGYCLESDDPDVRLAARLAGRDIDYVMLSTRKVYAPGDGPLGETAPLGPGDAYGRHKLAVEAWLGDRLGERLTILRLANVFGDERLPGRRTFLSILLERLARDGQIRFDMSPFVVRDFLPAARFAEILDRLLAAPPGGIVNVGSGIALPTGRLALWILEGFGRGELVIESPRDHDAFVLDVGRLRALQGEPCTLDDLATTCRGLGRRLAEDLSRPGSP